jgi:uncharacterized membrane protein YsdA (DUF1294 family)/cold shock CspA family protein
MKSNACRGQLIKWKDEQGFGFIKPVDGSREVFLHISELKASTRRPQVGDTIEYHLDVQAGKARASNASIVGISNQPNAPLQSQPKPTKPSSTETFPIIETLLLALIPLLGAIRLVMTTANPLPLVIYPAMSAVTFALYADDKSRARKGTWRVPEKTLHLCELAGGWPGGFIAQRKLRHKNRKTAYQVTFWAIVIIHQIVWITWLAGLI